MRKIKIILFILLPLNTFGQNIEWNCTSTQNDFSCNGYITTSIKKILVAQNYNFYMKQMSIYKKYSLNLGAVITGCGTECSSASFINLNTEQISNSFQDVIAVNPEEKYVAYLSKESIIIQSIFEKKNITILQPSFASTATLIDDIDEAKFLPNGNFYLSYESADPKDKGELQVKINYDGDKSEDLNGKN